MSDDSHEYDEDALEFIEGERARIAALHATCPNEIWPNTAAELIMEMKEQLSSRDAEVAELRNELETERMRNVACGVVAMADTHDSARQAQDMHPDYMSASCSAVARRVDECIKLREQVKLLRGALEKIFSQEADNGCILSAGDCAELAREALAATEVMP